MGEIQESVMKQLMSILTDDFACRPLCLRADSNPNEAMDSNPAASMLGLRRIFA